MTLLNIIPQPSEIQNVSCGFWDLEAQKWSSEGCRLNRELSDNQKTVCDCVHLTRFQLLTLLEVSWHNLTLQGSSITINLNSYHRGCFNSFNLFMDWTGQCYGLPATPTTDILSKVLDSFSYNLIFYITIRNWNIGHNYIPKVCLALSATCLVISEGLDHFSRKMRTRQAALEHINKVQRRLTTILPTFSQVQIRSVQRLRNAWLALAQLCWLLLTELPTEISNSNIVCQLCGAITHLAWMLFWITSGESTY